jgi:hypothetical protein
MAKNSVVKEIEASDQMKEFAQIAAASLREKPEADKAKRIAETKKILAEERKAIRDARAQNVYHKRHTREIRTYLNLGSFFVNAAGVAGIAILAFGQPDARNEQGAEVIKGDAPKATI